MVQAPSNEQLTATRQALEARTDFRMLNAAENWVDEAVQPGPPPRAKRGTTIPPPRPALSLPVANEDILNAWENVFRSAEEDAELENDEDLMLIPLEFEDVPLPEAEVNTTDGYPVSLTRLDFSQDVGHEFRASTIPLSLSLFSHLGTLGPPSKYRCDSRCAKEASSRNSSVGEWSATLHDSECEFCLRKCLTEFPERGVRGFSRSLRRRRQSTRRLRGAGRYCDTVRAYFQSLQHPAPVACQEGEL